MIDDEEIEAFLAHHGVRGQKWGIRRNKKTGVRPIANTLDKSKFGQAANRNAQQHNATIEKRHANQSHELSTAQKALIVAGAGFAGLFLLRFGKNLAYLAAR